MVRRWEEVWGEGAKSPKAGVPARPSFTPRLPATIALLAEDGHLVSLGKDPEEGASSAPAMGSPLLQERKTYILVQIISKWSPRLCPILKCKGKKAGYRQPKALPSPLPWPGPSSNLCLPSTLSCLPCPGQHRSQVKGKKGTIRPARVFCPLHHPQEEKEEPPLAMCPYWRTWMTGILSWQVNVRAEPQGEGTSALQSPPAGFSGPSRGATLAVRPPGYRQQQEETHGQPAWPAGARHSLKVPKGGLADVQDPLAGARSPV